jgi:hypothetical protein
MEIIAYVREGAIAHQDSLGNKGRTRQQGDVRGDERGHRHPPFGIQHGSVDRISSGSCPPAAARLQAGARPSQGRAGQEQFVALASGYEGDGDALPIRTDARAVLGATLRAAATYPLGKARKAFLYPQQAR